MEQLHLSDLTKSLTETHGQQYPIIPRQLEDRIEDFEYYWHDVERQYRDLEHLVWRLRRRHKFDHTRYHICMFTRYYFDQEDNYYRVKQQLSDIEEEISQLKARWRHEISLNNRRHQDSPATRSKLTQRAPVSCRISSLQSSVSPETSSSSPTFPKSTAPVFNAADYDAREDWEVIRLQRKATRGKLETHLEVDHNRNAVTALNLEGSNDYMRPVNKSDSPPSSQELPKSFAGPCCNESEEHISLELRKLSLLVNMPAQRRESLERSLGKFVHDSRMRSHSNAEDTCLICTPPGSSYSSQKHVKTTVALVDPASFGIGTTQYLNMQVGTIYMILNETLTKEQQWGWVHGKWEMSHLCGNAACLNPLHHSMEPREINMQRIWCHKHGTYYACKHSPKCLLRDKEGNVRPAKTWDDEQEKLFRKKSGKRFSAYGFSSHMNMPRTLEPEVRDKRSGRKRSASESGCCSEFGSQTGSRPPKQSKPAPLPSRPTARKGKFPFDPKKMTWFTLSSSSKSSVEWPHAKA